MLDKNEGSVNAAKAKQLRNKKTEDELEMLGMVGRCFIIWGDDGLWKSQGIIRGEPAPGMYLCQFFECFMGFPSTMTILPLTRFLSCAWREPDGIILFRNDEHLRDWIDNNAPRRAITDGETKRILK